MYSMPVRTVCTFLTSPRMQAAAYILPKVASSQPGTMIGMFFLGSGDHPAVLGVDLVILLERALLDQAIEKLVRKVALAVFVGSRPLFEHRLFDPAHGFAFRNAGVGDAIEVAIEKLLLVLRGEIAIVRDALVVIVRNEVEDVFFEVGAGRADQVDLVLADHLSKRQTQLSRAHRAGERDHHFAAAFDVLFIAFSRVHERRRVEVAIVMLDKL